VRGRVDARRLARLSTLVLIIVGLVGCGDGDEPNMDAASKSSRSDFVLKVGDEEVGMAEYKRHLAFENPERAGAKATPQSRRALRQRVFDKLLMIAALRQEARRVGISVSQEQERAGAARTRKGLGPEGFEKLIGPYNHRDFEKLVGNGLLLKKLLAANKKRDVTETWLSTAQTKDLPERWRKQTVCGEGFHSAACQG
jgi:SurA N-terminal domain